MTRGSAEPSLWLTYLPELVARKLAGPAQSSLDDDDAARFAAEYARLRTELEAARDANRLPNEPGCRADVNDLLVRVRLGER